MSRWTWAIVILGLSLRAYHYFRTPVVWHDEAALLMNVITHNYAELVGPLSYDQAAPPLFLWLERASYLILGDSLLALRLLPFLASCASLLLMVMICRRSLTSQAAPWALFFFSCSDALLWHGSEAKPYAVDVFVATLLLTIHVVHRGAGLLSRELLCYALAAPVLILLSYPACFLYGGVLVVLFFRTIRAHRRRPWNLYVLLCALVLGTFALLALGPIRAQRNPSLEGYWSAFFAPWDRPWRVPIWSVAQTLELPRYCLKQYGQFLTWLALLGGILLWRRRERELLLLLALPIFLTFAAACLHRYPYGGTRLHAFLAPSVILLIAVAVPPTLRWLRVRNRLATVLLVLLLLTPALPATLHFVKPWPRPDDKEAATWVASQRREGEIVVGNSFCHQFYFRHAGEQFHKHWDHTSPKAHSVAWVLYTEHVPSDARSIKMVEYVPPAWVIVEQRHFRYVTVAKVQTKASQRADRSLRK